LFYFTRERWRLRTVDWGKRFGYWTEKKDGKREIFASPFPQQSVNFFMNKGAFNSHAPPLIFFCTRRSSSSPLIIALSHSLDGPSGGTETKTTILLLQKATQRKKESERQKKESGKMPEYVWKNSLFFWKNSLSLSILLSIYIQDWGVDFANGRVTLGEMGMGTRRLVFLGLSLGLCFRAWSKPFSTLKPLSAVPQHH
jgi:hypothetical protein